MSPKMLKLFVVVPTVCSLLDIEIPSNIQGHDLTAYFNEQPPEDRYVYCKSLTATKYQGNSLLAVVGNRYKYIQTTRPELYDIINDPAELNILAAAKPQIARIMQDKLKVILEDIPDSRVESNKDIAG